MATAVQSTANDTNRGDEVLYAVADRVATITLNRPERMNTISRDMLNQLTQRLLEADADREVRAVILTGTGRAFCAGLDLTEVTRPDNTGGITGGTGPMNSLGRTPGQVNLGQVQQVALPKPSAQATSGVATNTPKVIWKPKPAYTAEATALHINGVVQVRIRVSASGSVTVLAVTRPLGHGLDQSAERAAESMRFQPAVDANGHPVDWEGNVTVTFQTESNG